MNSFSLPPKIPNLSQYVTPDRLIEKGKILSNAKAIITSKMARVLDILKQLAALKIPEPKNNRVVIRDLKALSKELDNTVKSTDKLTTSLLESGSREEIVKTIADLKKFHTDLKTFGIQLDTIVGRVSWNDKTELAEGENPFASIPRAAKDCQAQIKKLEAHLVDRFVEPESYDALKRIGKNASGISRLSKELDVVSGQSVKLQLIGSKLDTLAQTQEALKECKRAQDQLVNIDREAFNIAKSDISFFDTTAPGFRQKFSEVQKGLQEQQRFLLDKQKLLIAEDALKTARLEVDGAASVSSALDAQANFNYIWAALNNSLNSPQLDPRNQALYENLSVAVGDLSQSLNNKFSLHKSPQMIENLIGFFPQTLDELNDLTPTMQIAKAQALVQGCGSAINSLEQAGIQFQWRGDVKTHQKEAIATLERIRDEALEVIQTNEKVIAEDRKAIALWKQEVDRLRDEYPILMANKSWSVKADSLNQLMDKLAHVTAGLEGVQLAEDSPSLFMRTHILRQAALLRQKCAVQSEAVQLAGKHENEANLISKEEEASIEELQAAESHPPEDQRMGEIKQAADKLWESKKELLSKQGFQDKVDKLSVIAEEANRLLAEIEALKDEPDSAFLDATKKKLEIMQSFAAAELISVEKAASSERDANRMIDISSRLSSIVDNLQKVDPDDLVGSMSKIASGLSEIKKTNELISQIKQEIDSDLKDILIDVEKQLSDQRNTFLDYFFRASDGVGKLYRSEMEELKQKPSVNTLSKFQELIAKIDGLRAGIASEKLEEKEGDHKVRQSQIISSIDKLLSDVYYEIFLTVDACLPELIEQKNRLIKEEPEVETFRHAVRLNALSYLRLDKTHPPYANWDKKAEYEKMKDDLAAAQKASVGQYITSNKLTPRERIDKAMDALGIAQGATDAIMGLSSSEQRLQAFSQVHSHLEVVYQNLLDIKMDSQSPNRSDLEIARRQATTQLFDVIAGELFAIEELLLTTKSSELDSLKSHVEDLSRRMANVKLSEPELNAKLETLKRMSQNIAVNISKWEKEIAEHKDIVEVREFTSKFLHPYLSGARNPETEPKRDSFLDQLKTHFKTLGKDWSPELEGMAIDSFVNESVKGLTQIVAKFEADRARDRLLRKESGGSLPALVTVAPDSKIFQGFLDQLDSSFKKEFPGVKFSSQQLKQQAVSSLVALNQAVEQGGRAIQADLGKVNG